MMRNNKLHKTKKGRRLGRTLLVLLLIVCLSGAGYLAYLGTKELMERKKGDDFYTNLAISVENTLSPNDNKIVSKVEEEPTKLDNNTHSTQDNEVLPSKTKAIQATELAIKPIYTLAPSTPTAFIMPTKTPTRQTVSPTETPKILQPIDKQSTASLEPSATPFVNRSVVDFPTLWKTCPDVVGWICLKDSIIDYPVAQGTDNDFYLHHLVDKTENKAGSIMMDQANTGDFSDAVNILHGHHMRSGSMFGRLADYLDEEYYKSHQIIQLYTPAGDYDVTVFAAYSVNGYTFGYPTSFENEEAFDKFIHRAVSSTPYKTDVEVSYGDRLLLLSTCSYGFTGERCVVLGKIIQPGNAMN